MTYYYSNPTGPLLERISRVPRAGYTRVTLPTQKELSEAFEQVGKIHCCRPCHVILCLFGVKCPVSYGCSRCIKKKRYTSGEIKQIDDQYLKRKLKDYEDSGYSAPEITLKLPSGCTLTLSEYRAKQKLRLLQ